MIGATLPEQLVLALQLDPGHANRVAVYPAGDAPQTASASAVAAIASAPVTELQNTASLTYGQLDWIARSWASVLLNGNVLQAGQRVALLLPPGAPWVLGLRTIWYCGSAAVPLCLSHPLPEWEHVLEDARCSLLLTDKSFLPRLEPLLTRAPGLVRTIQDLFGSFPAAPGLYAGEGEALLPGEKEPFAREWPANSPEDAAHLVYTSGSTGKPKGAVVTHAQLAAQIKTLVQAWAWSANDRILNVLPLHHVHGMVNVYACALWTGATVMESGGFDAQKTWMALDQHKPSLFMAVPTVYQKLLQAHQAADPDTRRVWTAACANIRLMVSGSAALSPKLMEQWREISGNTLLERYGMTEIGMALGNPLEGERIAGSVGFPLPGVDCRIADESGAELEGEATGELQVCGPSVFKGYWNNAAARSAAFDGRWFRTGDLVHRDLNGRYWILGRLSVDIIKTGGFKVAAPEIEQMLLTHPAIAECAVVGLPDPIWGEQVGVVLVLHPGEVLTLDMLRTWARERLAVYKVPGRAVLTEVLPRNAMGKVVKPSLRALFRDGA